ncbi:unnamed protein product (macronuclear) [Paramecium tetraurelia]|uniref:DUF4200 domain-containing protein n=1 Tax=Paramecium tetraurelia TaxID=5888 RepID=A0BGA6_PARTE|nr:uncharacterized protein GSPATT00028608001 [Paramecium tetraurelia]CAK57573.1 unnamed protein product [Paramecium tetraurelia]|eukprot:XP_001424971.1 hypothetical protein (macronuclear) [Paramecium tetraurelia strain d4-2]
MSRTNLGSPSYYFSSSAPKLENFQQSPKKEFFDASRQLEKAKRRVQLLKLENEIREKKAQIQQQKSEQLTRIREDHEQFKEFKQMHREQVNVQIQNLVSRTRNLKRQQSQEKIYIQQNFLQMKQQEVKNIKEQSQKNEQLIRQNLDSLKQQKYEQKQQILTQEQLAQQSISNFHKQRYLKHQQDHYHSKSQHMIEAETKLSIIEELRKQEAQLLQKLETTSKMNTSLVARQISTTTPKTEFNN